MPAHHVPIVPKGRGDVSEDDPIHHGSGRAPFEKRPPGQGRLLDNGGVEGRLKRGGGRRKRIRKGRGERERERERERE